MRIATCKAGIFTVLGNGGGPSVHITPGWQGDLDQVIGKTDRGPMTLAEGLGDHLNDHNFDVQTRGKKPAESRPVVPAQE